MLRTVFGTVLSTADNAPRKGVVRFQFTGSFDGTAQYPPDTQTEKLDPNGSFSIDLWVNELGEIPSTYLCTLPGNDSFEFTLPQGTTPINLSLLRERGNSSILNQLDAHNNDPNAHPNLATGTGSNDNLGNLIASNTLSADRVLAVNSQGRAIYADNQIPSTANSVIGISTTAANGNSQIFYRSGGRYVEPTWNLIPNQNIFVGTNGNLTQTVPSTGYVLSVGVALSSTEILVRISKPVFRG